MTEIQATADAIPLPLPLFWPVAMVAGMEKMKADLALRNLEFVQEEIKLHGGLKAKVASPNVVRLDLRTMALRDYGRSPIRPSCSGMTRRAASSASAIPAILRAMEKQSGREFASADPTA
jgi:hypothetical protein